MADKNSKYLAYAGIPSFWRLPHTRELDGVDLVVMGVPFDSGVSNRTGARFGAQAVRTISLHTGNFHHPWDYDIKDRMAIIDYGDVGMSVGPDVLRDMISSTYEEAAKIYKSGARLLTLGGDHTIPYGLVRAAKEKFGSIALVHFDSHQDSLDGEGGKAIFHGTFAHDLAAEGTVDASSSTQVFIRTDMPNENGYNILYAKDTLHMTPAQVADVIRANAAGRPVYITLDVDSLDPAFAPGTGTPVPGGPSTAFVREVLQRLEGLNVVGADIVEVAPQYDAGEITVLAAGVLAGDMLQLLGRSLLASR
ncbi:agmatinase [Stenotrophomonas rhizophila]|uniref:agmatinase n=1 Tax=Stenotrophomonas rhizophila TaxID=216778 RepID=UPI0033969284